MSWTTLAQYRHHPGLRVYAEGWQSWSPATWYDSRLAGHRPGEAWQHLMRFRPGVALAPDGVQGEGLLAVDTGGQAVAYGAVDPTGSVPTIRARHRGDVVVIQADGPVEAYRGGDGIAALRAWGHHVADPIRRDRPAPRVWCTWYRFFEAITASDVVRNARRIRDIGLGIDVIQIDDGWAAGAGERFAPRAGMPDLPAVIDEVRGLGFEAGIWLAPWIAAAASPLVSANPSIVTGPAGINWGTDQVGLDPTAAAVQELVEGVVTRLAGMGVSYFKLDFLYAGALARPGEPREAGIRRYRSALAGIRRAAGPGAYLVGCGAPLLPSLGLVDAMRVSPDVFHEADQTGAAGLRGRLSALGRGWQNSVLWSADPDCLVLRPSYLQRMPWAEVVAGYGGLVSWSDEVDELDDRGIEVLREILDRDS
ncbi:MAG: glycoside hydrolase family 36 protein [Arachnia sp.]